MQGLKYKGLKYSIGVGVGVGKWIEGYIEGLFQIMR